MKSKIANFSAGPAAIPQEVLQEVKDELLNYKNIMLFLVHRLKCRLKYYYYIKSN